MKKFILAGALALGALVGSPRNARADCLREAVDSCNQDFGGNSNYYTVSIRGWCYLIRSGICGAGY